jgi:hypothetical protein
MNWALIFVAAVNQTPAHVSSFATEAACQQGIRTIYETRMIPRGVVLAPQAKAIIQQAVDTQLQYQREYRCLPIDKN